MNRWRAALLFAGGLAGVAASCGDDVLPAPGNAGEVCDQPDDCGSHTGGELPRALDVTGIADGAVWGWVVLVGDRYAGEVGE